MNVEKTVRRQECSIRRDLNLLCLPNKSSKLQPIFFRVLSSGALAGLYTNVFKVCHVLRKKTFELQRYINEPGLLFKFGFFKSFSADLVAKLPENCEVVKFQFLETTQMFLKMY